MTTPFQPKAYSVFVSVLAKDFSTSQPISRDQLLGGVAYYLTELPHNYVQAFVTLILGSPALWGTWPRSSPPEKIHSSAWGIMQATQQAVLTKHAALLADPNMSSILPPLGRQRVLLAFQEWLDLLVSGSQPRTGPRDCSIPRLAFLSGLVLSLQELQKKEIQIPSKTFSRACVELVVSVAECLDQYVVSALDALWDSQLALQIREAEGHVGAVVELCAAVLPVVPNEQLEALDLSKLACVCLGSILHVFHSGHCFDTLDSEMHTLESGLLGFQPQSKIPQRVQATHASSIYLHLGSIAQLVGHLFVCMAQSKFWQPKVYPILSAFVDGFGQMSSNMEKSWSQSALCMVKEDEKIDVDARPTTTVIWHMLKGLLFTTVLVAQSVLNVVIYYSAVTPKEGKVLSRSILVAFCRLSFISLKFGALAAEGGGFTEMKRAFFGALDVLASNADDHDATGDRSCVKLVIDLATELSDIESAVGIANPIYHGRVTYFLVCAEHVMNQLTEETIERVVLPIVQRHLSDTENRERYEAAHSVMLSIFAASEAGPLANQRSSPFSRAHLLVPAYINVLLQNSDEDKLTTDQLCLAFQALVRSAGSSDDELGWFCAEELSVAIRQLSAIPGSQPSEPISDERLLRLQLALVSSISAVPTSKLPLLLDTIHDQILHSTTSKDAIIQAAYHEIVERLGDREKDIALRWWMKLKANIGDVR